MIEERDDSETTEEYKERLLAEFFRETLAGTGITRDDITAAVPLRHDGPGGCSGVDTEEVYRQIATLLQGARVAQREKLITEAHIEARTRRELLNAIAKPPVGLPQTQQFRLIVDVALRIIAAGCGHFLQTCHTHMTLTPGLEGVLKDLLAAYKEPTAVSISNVSQSINRHLKVT